MHGTVETIMNDGAEGVALGLEIVSILFILVGAVHGLLRILRGLPGRLDPIEARVAFIHLARWLLLALEFTVAADVVRTAILPDWNDIGQLAAIAAIRTFLNVFLS